MNQNMRDRTGSLEFLHGGHMGPCRLFKNGYPGGYLSKNGGFTLKIKNAVVFNGPGEAIREAACAGFAILNW